MPSRSPHRWVEPPVVPSPR